MAKFEEEKVINALHIEKAEVEKEYYFSDDILNLKEAVENEGMYSKLKYITKNSIYPFTDTYNSWSFIYPYEEPPKQRMTYRQLAEWLAKGNGECIDSKNKYRLPMCTLSYSEEKRDELVWQECVIRSWDSEEWIEPTYEIYLKDCKGGGVKIE